jgi:hypothetical protein
MTLSSRPVGPSYVYETEPPYPSVDTSGRPKSSKVVVAIVVEPLVEMTDVGRPVDPS